MATYITVEDVDAYAASDTWAETDKKPRFVVMANAWLSSKKVSDTAPIPEEVKTAGCEVALAAADGELYVSRTEGLVTKKRVKAGSVESEKTYADVSALYGANSALPERLQLALALIDPYITIGMSIVVGYGGRAC